MPEGIARYVWKATFVFSCLSVSLRESAMMCSHTSASLVHTSRPLGSETVTEGQSMRADVAFAGKLSEMQREATGACLRELCCMC